MNNSDTNQAEQLRENAVMQSVILPNELCVGNLFYRTNKHTKERIKIELTASCIMDILHNGENSSFIYEPIKISKRRLLKFGFIESNLDEDNAWLNLKYRFLNFSSDESVGFEKVYLSINKMDIICDYVHQFQNLYFNLTRVSLTVA